MQKLSTENLKVGMKMARSIYDVDGQLLLSKGMLLTDTYIRRLELLQIPSVYIETTIPHLNIKYPDDHDVDDDVIGEKLRISTIRNVSQTFHKCQLTGTIDEESILHTTEDIINGLLLNPNNVVQATDIRRYDDYTFAHSVNVCVLSVMLGLLCEYSRQKLDELALGALLHDIGKTKIPLSILNKPGALSDEESEIMKKHSEIGFELLRKTTKFSVVPMHIAFQHHEKYDGSGYPRELFGNNIHEYARIVAIADVYDALTSDRPYKKSCLPHIAYKIMMEEGSSHFDPVLLKLFFDNVAIYPIGTAVQISTGQYGIVINTLKGCTLRPVLQLIANQNKTLISSNFILDLRDYKNTSILRVIREDELADIFSIDWEQSS
ncbi:HD-GYP domain-containing protein [Anaerosinus massiliensis]|uniref:HD-GYP domain-containing protein n=1 Tax=Massilibacillus massiliensis TaxID=1806837 RepID=UPI000ABDE8EF|nr:HD-GYP domain-containing protein [Massilibacillus massiliensis]